MSGLLLDTNIVIHLRDGDRSITIRLADMEAPLAMSAVSLAELEAGMSGDGDAALRRRRRLDRLQRTITVLPFTAAEAAVYGRIVGALGFDRRKVLDRLIAAQAIVGNSVLVTRNGDDFRDIPGLRLEVW